MLLRNVEILFEIYLLKQVWNLFSSNISNLRFYAHLKSYGLLKPAATVRVDANNDISCVWEMNNRFVNPLIALRISSVGGGVADLSAELYYVLCCYAT